MQSSSSHLRLAAWLGAMFAVIFGAKLWIIQVYATDMPYWDQWDEARLLIKPWLSGHLNWSALFAPHNEHRIFFTRVLDLLEIKLNGQWDPRLQMVVNAAIHAGFAVGLAYCLWRFVGRKWEGLICLSLLPFFAFPVGAENVIHGFQSQMYFIEIFTLITICGLGLGTTGSLSWYGGLAAAVMSLFTLGSGLLIVFPVAGLLLLRATKEKRLGKNELVTLFCCGAVLAAGLFLNVTVAGHRQFRARSLLDFLDALLRNLAWPVRDQPVVLFLIALPLAIVGVKYLRSEIKNQAAAEFVLTFGLWGALQSVALAFSRSSLSGSNRYEDVLSAIPIASVGALLVIADNGGCQGISRRTQTLLAIAWAGLLVLGLGWKAATTLGTYRTSDNYLEWSRRWELIEIENVRAFIATGDARHLLDQPPLHIPYYRGDMLVELLNDPRLAGIMPPDCRRPLKLEPETSHAGDAFAVNGCSPQNPNRPFTRVWGSYSTNGDAATGRFVSQPMQAALPKLDVELCCASNADNLKAELVEISTGHRFTLKPPVTGRWQTITVNAPPGPFRLELTDDSGAAWIAAGEIKELGTLTFYARRLVAKSVFVLLAGLSLCVLLAGWQVIRRADQRRTGIGLLLVSFAALAGVWPHRNSDATETTCRLHKDCAAWFVSRKQIVSADWHLREALWLQPGDREARKSLDELDKITGISSGPGKNPR
jgi:hypothetical protein